jgi:menaquinone-9 beta-reductase
LNIELKPADFKDNNNPVYDVTIVGGGLAGLINAIVLSKAGFKVLLLEKKVFPFNKVCGEYVSNEVLGFLNSLGFNPADYGASEINRLRISDPSGRNIFIDLDLGGFGLSRFTMDRALSNIARKAGAEIIENCKVTNIIFERDLFIVEFAEGVYLSRFVFGCYGKRDSLDKKLNRKFIEKHTGFMGVKYHITGNYPLNEIGLDNFPGGYCGIVKIEEDKYNLCYLYKRNRRIVFKNTRELEEKILFTNPAIKNIFNQSKFISATPEVINEISFDDKSRIENHIFLCGDSAGLIPPLCGNGMAMAIHGAKILSEIVKNNIFPGNNIFMDQRESLEKEYLKKWRNTFTRRLFWGRKLQSISGSSVITSSALKLIHSIPSLEKWLVNKTHGKNLG